ncbi:MAG: hypothetical protein Q7N50_03885 [Armatimonadota bacterium]|nr:hypothetical protein [Armatimonadota bacterium]
MRHIETMKGNGTVTTDDGQEVVVCYKLDVYQREMQSSALKDSYTSPVLGLKHCEGTIEPVCFFGQTLTLEMEDGRKLRFFFKDTSGTIALIEWIS